MQITLHTDYLIRVMIQAALRAPELVTIDEVAKTYGISRHHLVKIVHKLGQHGFLSTRRGIGGGFSLAQPVDKILLSELIRLGEGEEKIMDCTDRRNEVCRLFPACRFKDVLDEAEEAFFKVLEKYTLHDLVNRPKVMRRILDLPS